MRTLPPRRGQHRAADRITELEDQIRAVTTHLMQADAVLNRLTGQRLADETTITNLTAANNDLTVENSELRDAYDELFARYLEVKAVAANATAVSTSLGRHGDGEEAVELPAPGLFGLDGTRVPTTHKVIPLQRRNAA